MPRLEATKGGGYGPLSFCLPRKWTALRQLKSFVKGHPSHLPIRRDGSTYRV